MLLSNNLQVFLKFLYIFISIKCTETSLLYPRSSVMQLVGSISVPIVDLPPNRKVLFDWGLQMNYDMPYNISSFYMIPIWPTTTHGSRNFLPKTNTTRAVHKRDFTAKQLYEGLENMLETYGYDRSCLKRSICELSQHPFDEAHANVAVDVVNFLLKPSIHQGFSADEQYDETLYRLAEHQGFMGENCNDLYPKCINSLFNILTMTELMEN